VGGIDEVGRGALAGPVVAACVVINKDFKIKNSKLKLVNDSKKIAPKLREYLYDVIISEIPNIGIGIASCTEVDRYNVLQATLIAMERAVKAIDMTPSHLVIDGRNILKNLKVSQQAVIKGDSKIFVIAAASIIAKVERDRIMVKYHKKYPVYGFSQHVGYGTKKHLVNLRKYGPCKIHRYSYLPVIESTKTFE
jgi:ribonuclease HII